MQKLPFDLAGRERMEGGTLLFFRCRACGGEATVFVRLDDPLRSRYPLACACGVHVNIYFGSPLVGKALLRALRDLADPPPEAPPGPSACYN